jgi:signal transduction histidine kinase
MAVKRSTGKKQAPHSGGWKARYEKEKFIVNSMTSLLNRYGNSIEPEQLYGAFLLTLMGQFGVTDSSYFTYDPTSDSLEPAISFGRLGWTDLPPIHLRPGVTGLFKTVLEPTSIDDFPMGDASDSTIRFLTSCYQIVVPIRMKDRLMGVLFLGEKVTEEPFTEADLDVLSALCAVSATTFNNAILYENAEHSVHEIRKLYNVRYEVINRITHEFRTPLTVIKAGTEILAKSDPDSDLVQLFVESEKRLEDLINSLLSLSQTTASEDADTNYSDPVPILHESVHRCSESANQKRIHVEVRQSLDLHHTQVRVRENDLRTSFDALLENAIKFSPMRSTIRVEIERSTDGPNIDRDGVQLPDWRQQTEREIREFLADSPDELPVRLAEVEQQATGPTDMNRRTATSGYFVIRISDEGIGIPEQDVPLVAEPFRQASNSPDLGVKGTGLGLALVHKVVTRHGGYLCCKSAESRGTTFSVFLPTEDEIGL